MAKPIQGRQFKVHGVTFTMIEGGRKKKTSIPLRSSIKKHYDLFLKAFARSARVEPYMVQDAFHSVLVRELERDRKCGRRSGIGNLKSYLKTAVVREYKRSLRDESRLVPFSKLGQEEFVRILEEWPGNMSSPAHLAEAQEVALLAKDKLEFLPLRQRHVMAMWCAGLSIPEIAVEADTTTGNVRFHKHAAIQSLREKFGIEIEETA